VYALRHATRPSLLERSCQIRHRERLREFVTGGFRHDAFIAKSPLAVSPAGQPERHRAAHESGRGEILRFVDEHGGGVVGPRIGPPIATRVCFRAAQEDLHLCGRTRRSYPGAAGCTKFTFQGFAQSPHRTIEGFEDFVQVACLHHRPRQMQDLDVQRRAQACFLVRAIA